MYFQVCGVVERTKYYAIWTLTEVFVFLCLGLATALTVCVFKKGASILTGLGFTGYSPTGQSLWHGAANVNILLIELPPNFKVLLDSWNMKTNVWLRECIYKRVTPKGKKPGFWSSMTTFTTSAVWVSLYFLTFSRQWYSYVAPPAWYRGGLLPDIPAWRLHDNC